jgi:uncharacterized protein YggE
MKKLSFSILLLAAAPVFGQLESHTVAISATRQISLQPDQVVLSLSVTSSPTANLNQIVGPLSGLGITADNLTSSNTIAAPPNVQWNFTLDVPLSSLSASMGSITNLEQTIAQNNSGLALTFSVNGTQVSQQLQQAQSCPNSDLINDATVQAQSLASAAGLTLGPILKLSSAPASETSVPTAPVRYGNFLDGVLTITFAQVSSAPIAPIASTVTCSLVVKFQLLP